jgi:hypothetical protein
MKAKEKHSISNITFQNRWKYRKYSRNCDWTIIGISKWWASVNKYSYNLCLFGFELKIWVKREFID